MLCVILFICMKMVDFFLMMFINCYVVSVEFLQLVDYIVHY